MRKLGKFDPQRLATQRSPKDTEEEGGRHIDEPSRGRDHDKTGDGAHEGRVDGPLARLVEGEEVPGQGTRGGAQVGDAEGHDGLEVEGQGGAGIEGKPGTPDDDQGQKLEEGVAWPVDANVGGRADVGLARAEERVGKVDADGGSGGTGADVDGGPCMIGGFWLVAVLECQDLNAGFFFFFFFGNVDLPPAKSKTPKPSPRKPPPHTICASGQ